MPDTPKLGFVNDLLQKFGLIKPPPEPEPEPEPAPQFIQPPEATQGTAPLSEADKAKESEDRRYLIAAYEENPELIPEFKDATYMYKLISNERDYMQEVLNSKVADRKFLQTKAYAGGLSPEEERQVQDLGREIQAYRSELSRLFLLIKKVTGVNKSGTGGTDFLDPFKRG
jgi:hypothetical protein